MSSEELSQWFIYYKIELVGEARVDYHFANLCSLLANINRDTKKRFSPFTYKDFLLDTKHKKRKTIDREAIAKAWKSYLGGK